MEKIKKVWEFLKRPFVRKGILVLSAGILGFYLVRSKFKTVAMTSFIAALDSNKVQEIVDYGDIVSFKLNNGTWSRTNAALIDKNYIVSQARSLGVEYSANTFYRELSKFALQFGFPVAFLGILYWIQYSGKSYKRSLEHTTNINFADIAGNERAKQDLKEIIQFFKHPEKFQKVGATLPRGVLLYGPSGTGKTMLAKAVATEAGVNFISASGSEFIEMYVGLGARRVREVFAQARENKPCILFIDEIDSLAMKRGTVSDKSGMEYHSTVNQLLSEMDGFASSDEIVVLGATNNYTSIDEAILRPGRFDRKIGVNLPTEETRFNILKLSLEGRANKVSEEFLMRIARDTQEYSGADISNIVNEASFVSVRNNRDCIEEEDIQLAFTEVQETKRSFLIEKLYKSKSRNISGYSFELINDLGVLRELLKHFLCVSKFKVVVLKGREAHTTHQGIIAFFEFCCEPTAPWEYHRRFFVS